MYRLFYFIGFLLRQFVLSNPFAPIGDNTDIVNWVVGALFVPITYFMVGAIYDRGSEPAWGCILFNIIYAVNTGITYLVCLAYPMIWLMVAIAVAYLVLCFFVACRIHMVS